MKTTLQAVLQLLWEMPQLYQPGFGLHSTIRQDSLPLKALLLVSIMKTVLVFLNLDYRPLDLLYQLNPELSGSTLHTLGSVSTMK